jgi:SAM-dependent methyltransferase
MTTATYIHGTETEEQARLRLLNHLTNDAFITFLELNEGDHALEVGSGLGLLTNAVATRLPRGEVCGVERSPEQMSEAARAYPRLRFVQGDAQALPFADESFDVVYGRYILEHLADPARSLAEARRVLKTGGKAFFQENDITALRCDPEMPTFASVWGRFARLQAMCGGDALIGRRLYSLFRLAGFTSVRLSIQPEVHHAGSDTFGPWVENIAGNVRGAAPLLLTHGLATDGELARACAELDEFGARDDASIIFYWNRAAGVKV